jgi:hypothetical protein
MAMAHAPSGNGIGNGNGIVRWSGPLDNCIGKHPRFDPTSKNLYAFSAPLWLKSLFVV